MHRGFARIFCCGAPLLMFLLASGCEAVEDLFDPEPDTAPGYITVRNRQPITVTNAYLLDCTTPDTAVKADSLLPRETIRSGGDRTFRFALPTCYDAVFINDTARTDSGEVVVDTIATRSRMELAPGDTFVVSLLP